jgi:transcriptional regulator with XRE-family HTH domain
MYGDKMKILGNESNKDIMKEIGERIKSRRISLSITQEELSMISGVSLRTIVGVEKGMNVSLRSLIPILRAVKVSENIDLLIPENKTNPFEVIKLGHSRKRVSNKGIKRVSDWKWGDEK